MLGCTAPCLVELTFMEDPSIVLHGSPPRSPPSPLDGEGNQRVLDPTPPSSVFCLGSKNHNQILLLD